VGEMSLPVILDPEAREEFDEAYDYYESRRSGLGEVYADAVEIVLERIGKTPRIHQIVFGKFRRAVVRGFPFCIYYREESAHIRVISVFHTSRDPSVWQARA
jgi:toxin ParE1/3/4